MPVSHPSASPTVYSAASKWWRATRHKKKKKKEVAVSLEVNTRWDAMACNAMNGDVLVCAYKYDEVYGVMIDEG